MQDYVEQCFMDMDTAVIGDVAELAEVIHELADPRPGCADHVGEGFLGDRRDHALRFSGLAELSHDEQCACETLLAVVEELVDEVFLSPDSPEQDEL